MSIVMMLGGFVQAVIVGNIALIVTNGDAAASRYRDQSNFVLSTARYLELPTTITDRIRDYYDFMQSASHPGKDGMRELEKLPKKLYEDIVFHMHGAALSAVPLLRGLEPSFLQELSLTITAHIVLPEEAVFEEGDISREMCVRLQLRRRASYCVRLTSPSLSDTAFDLSVSPPFIDRYFIVHGQCAVLGEHAQIDGGAVKELPAGSFIGELALLAVRALSARTTALTRPAFPAPRLPPCADRLNLRACASVFSA